MSDLDEQAIEWAQACQDVGSAGFCIRTLDDGSVRLIGLSLPPKMVARMLRIAADAYEEQVPAEVLN